MDVSPNQVRPKRDSMYYFDTVTLLVENCLFKVQKRHFDGPLRNILGLPSDDARSSDQEPIHLMGIGKDDLGRLLEMMDPVCRPASISRDEWEYALKLSCVCDVPDMKKMAVEEIAKMGMDSTDKILLGQAYGVLDWLFSGYKELVVRDEPISRTEGRRLGTDIVTGLCHVREAAMQAKNGQMGKGRKKVHDVKFKYKYEDNIRREFAQELKNAEGPPKISGTERPHIDESLRVALMFTPARNDKFYIEHLVFLVEDTLFKVPRTAFDAIGIFETIFKLPVPHDTPREGSDDEHPFKLEGGVKEAEFRAFLRVLYPQDMLVRTADLSEEECISVLKLADMWEHLEIRGLAINELSNRAMDPLTKVLLAKQYNIPTWLRVAYQHLVNRKEVITNEDARQLGLDAAVRIFHLRDKAMTRVFHESGMVHEHEVPWHIDENDIDIAFAQELKDVT